MIGTEHLARVLARPPVNVEVMGIDPDVHPDDISDAQREQYAQALIRFWDGEGVRWPDVIEWARLNAKEAQRELFAGIEMTLEEHDTIENALVYKHLSGFTLGWMLARGMGNDSEENDGEPT